MPTSTTQTSTPSSRFALNGFSILIICVLSLLIIVGGVGLYWELNSQPIKQVALFDGKQFTPNELVLIEAALAKKNLCDYTVVNQSLQIPISKRSAYIAALAEANALPQECGRTLEKTAVDISLFDSPEVRSLKIKAAQQKDLADIINSIEGISGATALWDVEKQGGLNPKTVVRASVSFKSIPGTELDEEKIESIRRLTANAIAGLNPENIVIVDTRTGICYDNSTVTSNSVTEHELAISPEKIKDPALSKRLTAEQFWNKKISDLVRLSVDRAIVQTTVVLSDSQSETERKIEHDSEPTIYRSEVVEDVVPATFGINQPESIDEEAGTLNASRNSQLATNTGEKTVRRTETEEGVLGGKETITQRVPLAEKSVSVSVVIPMDSIVILCRRRGLIGIEPQDTDSTILEQTATAEQTKLLKVIANILPQDDAQTEPEKYINISFGEASGRTSCELRVASCENVKRSSEVIGSKTITDSNDSLQPHNSQLATDDTSLATRNSQLATNTTDNSQLATQKETSVFWLSVVSTCQQLWNNYSNEILIILGTFVGVIVFVIFLWIATKKKRETKSEKREDLEGGNEPKRNYILNKPEERSEMREELKGGNEAKRNYSFDDVEEDLHGTLSPAEALLNMVENEAKEDNLATRNSQLATQSLNPLFAFLQDVPCTRLAQVLSVERPQSTALILSQISEREAAQTLACFSMDYRAQTVDRLLHLETPDSEILADVATSLKERLENFPEEKANAKNLSQDAFDSVDKLSKILTMADVETGQDIIQTIKMTDKTAIEPLYPVGVTFDDIAQLDADSIRNIFDIANPNEAALSLVGAKKEVINKILSVLPEPEQQKYRSQLWLVGPTKLSDVEESRRRLVLLTMDLAVQGKVSLPDRFYPGVNIPFEPVKIRA